MTFAEKVYDAVSRIPKGRVATYGQIADIIGCPGGSRAVGNALHVNPFAPVGPAESTEPVQSADSAPTAQTRRIVPCHRVVAADGLLAAHFGGGGPAVQYSRLAPEGVAFLPVPGLRSATNTAPAVSAAPSANAAPAASVAPSANAAPAASFADAAPAALTPHHTSGLDPHTPPAPIPRVDLSRSGIIIERHPLEPFLPAGARILFLGSFPPPRARWSMDFFYPNWINDFWRIQGLIHFNDPHYFEYKSLSAAPKRFDRACIIDFCTSHGLAFYDTASKVCRWKGNASDEFLEILQPADIVGMLTQMPDCHTIVSTGGKSAEELATILSASGAILSASGAIPVSGVPASGTSPSGAIPLSAVPASGTPSSGAIPVSGVPASGTSPYACATALTSDTFIPLRSSSGAAPSSCSSAPLSSGSGTLAALGSAFESAPAITPPPVGSYLDLTLAGRPLRWWRMPSTSRAYPMPLAAKAAQYSLLFQ